MNVFLPILFWCFAFATTEILEDGREAVSPEYLDWLLDNENYEEFNRLLGIDIPHLSRPRIGNATHHPRFSPYLEHGDILLTPKQKETFRQASSNPNLKWKDEIPYAISKQFSSDKKRILEKGIARFNTHCDGCLYLTPRTNQIDYIMLFEGNGCYSAMGRVGGQQSLSIGEGCLDVATIVHELMHAIGFWHEHCRPDRDDNIEMLWSNIIKDWQSQFYKASPDEVVSYGEYDLLSVMHYPMRHPDVSKNRPCFNIFDPTIDENEIGYAEDASQTDIDKIHNMYC